MEEPYMEAEIVELSMEVKRLRVYSLMERRLPV
jgi:hypothetical protein